MIAVNQTTLLAFHCLHNSTLQLGQFGVSSLGSLYSVEVMHTKLIKVNLTILDVGAEGSDSFKC